MNFRFFISVFALLLMTLVACEQDYDTLRQRELASGIRHDSIFMGYYFGMPRADFYVHSHEMNQQGLVTSGSENTSILYVMEGYLQPININFYPDFSSDKIFNMKVWFDYQTWAPWNKEYFSEKLVPDALAILEKWCGGGSAFIKQRNAEGKPFWINVQGNREITLYILDERRLRADITDISVTPQPNPSTAGQPTAPRPIWEQQAK